MWAGYDLFSEKNIFGEYDISTAFYNEGRNPHKEGLLYLLFEEHFGETDYVGLSLLLESSEIYH